MGDVDTDVPMLVIDQQATVGGRRVCTDGSGLDSESPTHVLCSTTEEVEEYEEQEEDSGKRDETGPERRVCDSKTGIEISHQEVTEMEEIMNHHAFDEVPESEARERLVAVEVAAFVGKRDDNHAMTRSQSCPERAWTSCVSSLFLALAIMRLGTWR